MEAPDVWNDSGFLKAKAVVSLRQNNRNRLGILKFSGKVSASSCQCGDIIVQISIGTFHRESVIFIEGVVNMLSRVDHIQISFR